MGAVAVSGVLVFVARPLGWVDRSHAGGARRCRELSLSCMGRMCRL